MPAILFGMTVMLGAFVVGVLSTVEKARAVNLREGFIGALRLYLARGLGPPGYAGWRNVRNCFSECGARRKLGVCARRIAYRGQVSCRDEGEARAGAINAAKRLLPAPLLSSFTSLSSIIYGVIFVSLLALLNVAMAETLRSMLRISPQATVGWFALGFLLSAVVWRWKRILIAFGVGFGASLLGGTVLSGVQWWLGSVFGVGLFLGALGWFLAGQIRDCRMGRFSFETGLYTWLTVLSHCRPPTMDPPCKGTPEPPGKLRRALDWLINRKSHGALVDDYLDKSKVPYA